MASRDIIAYCLCLQECAVLTVLGYGIKALENRPREVSLSLNHTAYITALSVQALLAFENFSVLTHLARD